MSNRIGAAILILAVAAVSLFIWIFWAYLSAGSNAVASLVLGLWSWSRDPKGPFGFSDDFTRGVYVNLSTTVLQFIFTFFLVSVVISRRDKSSRRRMKRWLASRLRDELFSLVISARQGKGATIDPTLELIQKSRVGFELRDWNAIQRFEDSLRQFLHYPKNIHCRSLLSESFDNLLRSLDVGTAKRKIYVDRIAVAFSYS
jgi:low affinity Fe/Cu permease